MSTLSIRELHDALNEDLKRLGSEGVTNDATRKTFTSRINGAIFEFGHKQADPDFWMGIKHYGSGPSSRFRMRRTTIVAAVPKAPVAAVKRTRRKAVPAV